MIIIPKCAGHLYVKSDVYGFRVVLLELMMGLRALDLKRPDPQVNLVVWAKPLLPNGKKLKTIMDARMEGQYSSKGAIMLAQTHPSLPRRGTTKTARHERSGGYFGADICYQGQNLRNNLT
ncbi:putative transferase [Helianthus anomalus]